jgi:hypothetical protein
VPEEARQPDPALVDLASAVADGSQVNWDAVEESSHEESVRRVVRELRLLSGMASAVRTGSVRRWGHLEVKEEIGRGSFGVVYRAFDTNLERDVALKLIARSSILKTFDWTRMLAEARRLAKISDGRVVTVHGADIHGDDVGIWMELIDGSTLEALLALQGPMSAREAAGIGVELAHALAAVHGAGLLHRDLKAQNVMRGRGGRIVLMDFGTGLTQSSNGRMADGLAGTPLYLAPELFQGANPSIASDLYSLGVLVYHLASNRYPVEGVTRDDVEQAHRAKRRQSLRDVRPDLPTAFVEVVERALARDPEARYATAGDFGAALAAISGPRPLLPPTPPATPTTPKPPSDLAWSRRQVLLGTAGLFGAVAVGGAAWRFLFRDEAPTPAESAESPTARAGSVPAAAVSYQVAASIHALRDGQDIRLSAGSRVRPGDRLFLTVEPSREAFVYVVNQDDTGKMFVLFPLSDHQPANPVAGGQVHRLPGRNADGTESYWQVTSSGGRERISVFVTPERPVTFERLLAQVPRAAEGRAVTYAPITADDLNLLRGVGGLASGPSPSGTTTIDAPFGGLSPLPDGPETTTGLWEREIVLLNP